jgi:hypothetical protein
MGAELGRISGPLLAANLVRNNVDLAFETDLVYLKVNSTPNYVGIKTAAPTSELFVNGTTRSDSLTTNTTTTIGNFVVSSNTIQHLSGKIYIRPDQTSNPTIAVTGAVRVGNLEIGDNYFSATTADTDITFDPPGTGKLIVNSDMYVTGGVHATGNITLDGNIYFGNETTDTVTINGHVASNMLPAPVTAGTLAAADGIVFITEDSQEYSSDGVNLPSYDIGSPSLRWKSLTVNVSNFFTTTFPDISIVANTIQTKTAGQDLILAPNGSGSIVALNLKFNQNTITNVAASPANNTEKSIILSPRGAGSTVVDSTASVKLPSGNNSNLLLTEYGQLRFNSTYHRYEGYVPAGQLVSLNNVYSSNSATYITPELTVNVGDNTIRFATNNVVKTYIDTTKFYSITAKLGGPTFTGRIVSNTTDTAISTPAGNTIVSGVSISDDTISVTSQPLTFNSTNRGYLKFSGKGVVLPFGTTLERPLTPENGEYRFNTETGSGEAYSTKTNSWVTMGGGGGGGGVDEVVAYSTMTEWALIFNL